MTEEKQLTPKQAAESIGVSDQSIYNWLADGTIRRFRTRGVKQKKRYLIPETEVERLRLEYNGLSEGNNFGLVVSA